MKTLIQNFRQLILVGLISFLTTSQSVGQVVSRLLSLDDQVQNYMPWYNPDVKTPALKTPIEDIEAVLEEDERSGRELPRIGIRQGVQYYTSHGILSQTGYFTKWRLDLSNDDAKSLKFKISLKVVPDDFVLFFYNEEYNFLVGPIKSKNFKDGNYISDYIPGNKVSIILFLPDGQIEIKENDIVINDIHVGLETTYAFDSAFGTSLPCNINVACDEGIGWDCQISSVCKIIIGNSACSGSLVNNDCCDLIPYILTANHCVAGANPANMVFRFNYQSPQCDPNVEPNPSQWIVFSGSQLRSNWNGTDFGLLELFEEGVEGISYAGWNREVNPPTNEVTCIHHPAGDVKKIAVNTDGIGTQGNFWLIQQFEAGLVEPGSSGSPLFDANGLIIGDLHGGDSNLGCEDNHGLEDNNTYGQLSISWNGDGSANSRLSDWLGSSHSPNTMDCMEYPTISGAEIICDEYYNLYLLQEDMPCKKTIDLNVSPSYLFEFGTPTSGSGKGLALKGASGASGLATLTYTLSSNNCNNTEIEYDFWVGKPSDPTYFLQAWYDPFLERITLSVPEILGATSYNWTVENLTFNNRSNYEKFSYQACPSSLDDISFSVTAVNKCGESKTLFGKINRDCGGGPFDPLQFSVYPNPSNGDFAIYFNQRNDKFLTLRSSNSDVQKCSIYNVQGEMITDFVVKNAMKTINGLASGIYFIKVYDNTSQSIKKIIIN